MSTASLAAGHSASALPTQITELLTLARRRIWAVRAVNLLRGAALLCIALGLSLLTLHVLWRALPVAGAAALSTLPLAAGLLAAWRRRPSLADSARWLDRELGAAAVFSTFLEFCIEQRTAATPRALQAFARDSAAALGRSRSALQAQPSPALAPLLALLGLCALLVALLSTLPGKSTSAAAAASESQTASGASAATMPIDAEQSNRAVRAALMQDRTTTPTARPAAAAAGPSPAPPQPLQSGDAEAGAPRTRQAGGSAQANGTGSSAANNAALATAAGAAVNIALRSRFRNLAFKATRPGQTEASGGGVGLDAPSAVAQTLAFDRAQSVLAARAGAALMNQSAASGTAGPVGALLQQRYVLLRDARQ